MKRTSTLRRTGFQIKPRKPLRRSRLKAKSKQSISLLQRKIWELLRQIAAKKYCNPDGTIDCYTCGSKDIQGSNRQLGHMIPKAACGAFLKYDLERNLRWQCASCNIFHGGMGIDFYRKMTLEIGPTAMNELIQDRRKTVNARDHYEKIYIEYQAIWQALQAN